MRRKVFAFAIMLAAAGLTTAADDYRLGPDSQPKDGVPQGEVTKGTWESKVFPGTVRDYWVYVPKQYDGQTPACLMVFQDGGGYQNRTGAWRVPVVFDNLIHAGEMPVTVGVFINPGSRPNAKPGDRPFNRSVEYDTLSDHYAQFLEKEILPEVQKRAKLRADPLSRAICGASSGGICASPSPGSGRTSSARCSAPSAASRTFAAATSTPG